MSTGAGQLQWATTQENVGGPFGIAFAELGYGYNSFAANTGPQYYYYYYARANWTEGKWVITGLDVTADSTRHDFTLKWTSTGGTYRGYIDNVEQMFATGLGDNGVSKHEAGAEASGCNDVMYSNYVSELTAQNWDTTWSYWLSGTATGQAPAYATWNIQPNSGWVGIQ